MSKYQIEIRGEWIGVFCGGCGRKMDDHTLSCPFKGRMVHVEAAGLEDEYDGLAEMYSFPGIPAVRKCGCGRLVEFKSHCPACDAPCPVFHRKGAECPVCKGAGYVRKEKA
jgi:hypothetical protein